MKNAVWTYTERFGDSRFVCGEWYCRCEVDRHKNARWYVGNDDTEYVKVFRSAVTAKEFAEKHF